ncbi:MAG: PQQ-dependent sugar dehydrogenase [Coriobacteriia bacterium]
MIHRVAHIRPVVALISLAAVTAVIITLTSTGCSRSSEPTVVERPEKPAEETTTPPTTGDLAAIDVMLEPLAKGLEQPLFVAEMPGSPGRLVVLQKTGRAVLLENGTATTSPFLDLSKRVSTSSEQGLLGLAFSPDFASNGRFYINYTDSDGSTVVARVTAPGDHTRADPDSEQELLRIEQPYANHNGGCIAIGPDGMLWIGMGDGGSGGDPDGNGQNPNALLGKMLRIDVGESGRAPTGEPYGIPADNPYADPPTEEAGFPEVWAMGLRNPWRFSFDRTTGDLWIGDVGQSAWEEIDFVAAPVGKQSPAVATPGKPVNFGWNRYEGNHTYPGGETVTDVPGFTRPVIEYDRAAGQSVTGGFVYRGTAYPALVGVYLYADFGSGRLWGARRGAHGALENVELLDTGKQLVSFGELADGELLVVDFAGEILKVTAK